MPGGIDKIERIRFAVVGFITQRRRLGLDGDSALTFELHAIENLSLFLPVSDGPCFLENAIGKRRLAMIDMGNNAKIPNQAWIYAVLRHSLSDSANSATSLAPAVLAGAADTSI